MTDFEKMYDRCIRRVRGLIRASVVEGAAEDYINEAYLSLIKSNGRVTDLSLFDASRKLIAIEKAGKTNNEYSRETTRQCGRCKQDLPMACFGMQMDKAIERRRLMRWCKECSNRYSKSYREADQDIKQKQALMRSRLPDSYVRHNLLKQGFKYVSPEMIVRNRAQIIAKRIANAKRLNPEVGFPSGFRLLSA